jgi:hypothetical protein
MSPHSAIPTSCLVSESCPFQPDWPPDISACACKVRRADLSGQQPWLQPLLLQAAPGFRSVSEQGLWVLHWRRQQQESGAVKQQWQQQENQCFLSQRYQTLLLLKLLSTAIKQRLKGVATGVAVAGDRRQWQTGDQRRQQQRQRLEPRSLERWLQTKTTARPSSCPSLTRRCAASPASLASVSGELSGAVVSVFDDGFRACHSELAPC